MLGVGRCSAVGGKGHQSRRQSEKHSRRQEEVLFGEKDIAHDGKRESLKEKEILVGPKGCLHFNVTVRISGTAAAAVVLEEREAGAAAARAAASAITV